MHVSAIAKPICQDPHEFVKPGQIVKVKVMEVDMKRQRISLTMRLDAAPFAPTRARPTRAVKQARASGNHPNPSALRYASQSPAAPSRWRLSALTEEMTAPLAEAR